MRIYANLVEMYSEEKRNLAEMGVRVHPQTYQDQDVRDRPEFETVELSPAVFTVLEPGLDLVAWLRDRVGEAGLAWAYAESEHRWSAIDDDVENDLNPGPAWPLRASVWREFLHDGKFAYTYAERFAIGGALRRIVDELIRNPDTRQAVLPVFQGAYDLPNLGGIARIPCSLQYQFLRRRGVLDVIYSMRSSDFVTHFPYDLFFAIDLQHRIATKVGIAVGRLTFFSGSLHAYKKDFGDVF